MLPGVGNFGACMRALRASGLEPATRAAATDGRPFLGICVGMQMLFDGSDESPGEPGLGIVPGRITSLPATVRLPQMGWNTLDARPGVQLLAGLPDPAWCYFVHTFAPEPDDDAVVAAWCDYGRRFAAAIESRPVVGHAVPPGEERRDRSRAARQFRASRGRLRWTSTRRSTCSKGASCGCCAATTTPTPCTTTIPSRSLAVSRIRAREWIHVVDLDAARDGGDANLGVIEAICANVNVRVESGGGVRSVEDASERFAAGVHRVVVGSAAVENPEIVEDLATMHPGRVAVGLDARVREVAIHGWTDETGLDLVDLARRFDAIPGVGAIVVTGIDRDGTLEGPDVGQLQAVLAAIETPLVASGGVGTLADLRALAAASHEGRGFTGAIVGRAIYEGRFTVAEGIAACSPSA